MSQQHPPTQKTLLVIGNGGREHSIIVSLLKSKNCNKIIWTSSNPGIPETEKKLIREKASTTQEIISTAKKHSADIVIVGPEEPLANGISDDLKKEGISCFGPSKEASMIEASKEFSKEFMVKNQIPTARFKTFNNYEDAINFVESVDYPIVIKASGLAGGKGVVIPDSKHESKATLHEMMVSRSTSSCDFVFFLTRF